MSGSCRRGIPGFHEILTRDVEPPVRPVFDVCLVLTSFADALGPTSATGRDPDLCKLSAAGAHILYVFSFPVF